MARDRLGDLGGVPRVGGHHGQAFAGREFGRASGQHRHAVAALEQFIESTAWILIHSQNGLLDYFRESVTTITPT